MSITYVDFIRRTYDFTNIYMIKRFTMYMVAYDYQN